MAPSKLRSRLPADDSISGIELKEVGMPIPIQIGFISLLLTRAGPISFMEDQSKETKERHDRDEERHGHPVLTPGRHLPVRGGRRSLLGRDEAFLKNLLRFFEVALFDL